MIELLRFYFDPSGNPWWQGAIYGNLLASVVLWVGAYFLIIKRHINCKQKWCFRIGKYPVEGTPYKTCVKHTTTLYHNSLKIRHTLRHPHADRLMRGKMKSNKEK